MKTIKILTAALLIMLAFSVVASASTGKDARSIAPPAFDWGNPEDADTETARLLKYSGISMPAQVWGSSEDLNEAGLQVLKVRDRVTLQAPAFSWGSPEDLDIREVEKLDTLAHLIRFPDVVIGDPQDIDASDLRNR